jgi:hypothetical protein
MKAYHVTPASNLLSILERGLIPAIGERSKKIEDVPYVFLFASKDDLETALYQWLGQEFEDLDEELLFLEVDLSKTQYQVGSFELTVSKPIASKNIVNVYNELWEKVSFDKILAASRSASNHSNELKQPEPCCGNNISHHQEFVDIDVRPEMLIR